MLGVLLTYVFQNLLWSALFSAVVLLFVATHYFPR